ncbi:MAG TPA: hypothetical protein VHS34_00090 [Terriglobales bacterium]|jgi:hypothetical protein|nr:hypothetical protein [Terriglobales bacterium]
MKKTGLLLLLCLATAVAAAAQQTESASAEQAGAQGTLMTMGTYPVERVQAPTAADLYCGGFVSKDLVPNANFVSGGLESPNTTKFARNDTIFLAGSGYQTGQRYEILRELQDPNRYELFAGQHSMLKAMGQPYSELGRVRIIDTRGKMAVAEVEFSCEAIVPGDIAVPFAEKPSISFHLPERFDRFKPSNDKASGRIVLAKDFDLLLGTGSKVYINVGANQGVKVGDYFRAVRTYEADLHDPVDSLSFKASTTDDTQLHPPTIEGGMFNKSKGATIHVADMPRRAVGEIVVINTTPTTSTGMLVFALEDVHVGDHVELDEQ